ASQRSVQRALQALAAAGRAQALGRGRTRRWVAAPAAAFATNLLLCTALPAF
ncbi:helix-turn-helix domain-containing protein, partial [Bordetella bronchiseptica]